MDGADPAAAARALLAELAAAADAERAAAALAARATERFVGRVGGERALARALANPAYAPLVGHRGARLEPAERIDDAARIVFAVRGRDGAEAAYLLALKGGAGWRVSGLVRRELSAF